MGLSEWFRTGDFSYSRVISLPEEDLRHCFTQTSGILPPEFLPEDMLFFDAETTGLSGGAGTFIFLVGMAWIAGNGVELEQHFLADFPGEPEFLKAIVERLIAHGLFVSYNGKSFDSHILKNRLLLNRMVFEIEHQLDLLHLCRQLWKKIIGSCSLTNIEREILQFERTNDIPGYDVPERYFEFLRTSDVDLLDDIFDHNYHDVVSLVRLFNVLSEVTNQEPEQIDSTVSSARFLGSLRSPRSLRSEGTTGSSGSSESTGSANKPGNVHLRVDLTGLAKYFLRRNTLKGMDYLRLAFQRGDFNAGKILSLVYKREKQWHRAVDIWEKMVSDKSLFPVLELAKYYEHHCRDYKKALHWVNEVFRFDLPLSSDIRTAIFKRKNRILKKIDTTIRGSEI